MPAAPAIARNVALFLGANGAALAVFHLGYVAAGDGILMFIAALLSMGTVGALLAAGFRAFAGPTAHGQTATALVSVLYILATPYAFSNMWFAAAAPVVSLDPHETAPDARGYHQHLPAHPSPADAVLVEVERAVYSKSSATWSTLVHRHGLVQAADGAPAWLMFDAEDEAQLQEALDRLAVETVTFGYSDDPAVAGALRRAKPQLGPVVIMKETWPQETVFWTCAGLTLGFTLLACLAIVVGTAREARRHDAAS